MSLVSPRVARELIIRPKRASSCMATGAPGRSEGLRELARKNQERVETCQQAAAMQGCSTTKE